MRQRKRNRLWFLSLMGFSAKRRDALSLSSLKTADTLVRNLVCGGCVGLFLAINQTHRTEEMRAEARRFVSDVAHLPYKEGGEGLLQMASAAFRFHPAKERRRRVHAETVA